MNEEGERAFNEAVIEVQQKFLAHKEWTSHKLQKLEDTLELDKQKLQRNYQHTVKKAG